MVSLHFTLRRNSTSWQFPFMTAGVHINILLPLLRRHETSPSSITQNSTRSLSPSINYLSRLVSPCEELRLAYCLETFVFVTKFLVSVTEILVLVSLTLGVRLVTRQLLLAPLKSIFVCVA